MTAWLQRTLLRTASWLVPGCRRADWLDEWMAELWQARRALGARAALAFCLGAFRDAFWLRRESFHWRLRETVSLDSPARCLGFLAILSAISLLVAFQIPASPRLPQRGDVYGGFLMIAVLLCLTLRVTSPSLGDHSENRHMPSLSTRLRRWFFLSAKIALILSMGYAPMRYMAYAIATDARGGKGGLVAQLLWILILALRWALRDQGNRCPVCLRVLANPVRVGQAAGYFLEWNCTELVCLRGHGMLYVPECHTSWFDAPRWLYLDSSWTEPDEDAATSSTAVCR